VRTTQDPREADDDLDDLRRALYRADATPADLQRYIESQGTAVAAEPESRDPQPAPPTTPARTRRRFLIGAASAAVAMTAVTALAVLQQPTTTPALSITPPAPEPRTAFQEIGDGQVLQVDPSRSGGPTPTSVWIRGTAAAAQRFDGTGNAVLTVELPTASSHRQRGVLSVYSSPASSISWRALRPATHPDEEPYEQIVARGTIGSHRDFATPSTFDYSGDAPTRIVLRAAADARWTLLIAGIPSTISELH
jgi:hypothetical protein